MRTTSVPAAALATLAAALLLTSCGDGGDGGAGDNRQDSKAGSACRISEMAVQVGPANAAPAAGDTGNLPVTLTNRSGAECTLDGLPTVEFHARGASTAVKPHEAADARRTTLAKEGVTSFTLTYVRGEGGGAKSLPVGMARLYLPGSTEAHGFKWSYGDVALKSDGRTPDASVTGFQQAGD